MCLVASFILLGRLKILLTSLWMKISKQSLFETLPASSVNVSGNTAPGNSCRSSQVVWFLQSIAPASFQVADFAGRGRGGNSCLTIHSPQRGFLLFWQVNEVFLVTSQYLHLPPFKLHSSTNEAESEILWIYIHTKLTYKYITYNRSGTYSVKIKEQMYFMN